MPSNVLLAESPPIGDMIAGPDVSHHQGKIDWDDLAAMSRYSSEEHASFAMNTETFRFAIIRVSDGEHMDETFERNWRSAYRVALVRGVYQYFRPGRGRAAAQASALLSAVDKAGGIESGYDLPPVLDVETLNGAEPKQVIEDVLAWTERIRKELGVMPILYTYPSFWAENRMGGCSELALWIAHYRGDDLPGARLALDKPPLIPVEQWSHWLFWQHSSRGKVDGVKGNVDLNVFNGSLSGMLRFMELAWDGKSWPEYFAPPASDEPISVDVEPIEVVPVACPIEVDPVPVVIETVDPFGPEAPTLPSRTPALDLPVLDARPGCMGWLSRLMGKR